MSTNRLNSRDRLYIRIAKNGIAIANSALWRKNKPKKQEGRWKDITECVVGCCSATEPTEESFIIFQGTSLSVNSNITSITYPGYSWTGSVGNGDFLVVPLPFDFHEDITVTCLVTSVAMDDVVSTVQGTGTITTSAAVISTDPDPQTFTLSVTSTPGSQYLVVLTDD